MKPSWILSLCLFSSCLLDGTLLAQTIWTVPNDTSVDAVIAQAAPGDVLLLGARHPSFTLNKGVTVQGLPGGTILDDGSVFTSHSVTVDVPAGQRASLSGLTLANGANGASISWSFLSLLGGQCDVADVVVGMVLVSGGSHVLQRLRGRLQMSGGICSLSNSSLAGALDFSGVAVITLPALYQSGGTLLASKVTATAVDGMPLSGPLPAALLQGTAWLTDCALTGGNRGTSLTSGPGAPALIGGGAVHVARTTLTPGSGQLPTPPSSGYLTEAQMVGMWSDATPARGNSFVTHATAGSSLGVMGIVVGFDAAPNVVPGVVEPVFGQPSQLIVARLELPAAGAVVTTPLSVPNIASLIGQSVWLQAIQVDGATMRASALVGGTIR